MDDYITVFDLSQSGYSHWGFLLIGLAFGIWGWFILSIIKGIQDRPQIERILNPFRRSKQIPTWAFPLLIGISIVLTIAGFGSYVEYRQNLNTLKSGQASYVEGEVYDFKPMPFSGHTPGLESFSVNNVSFSYSDFIKKAAFNNTSSHGGPIRNGLHVKIWYYRGEILKLLIRKNEAPTQAQAAP